MARIRQICIAVVALVLLMAGGGVGEGERTAAAAQAQHSAGVVVQFADGSTRTYCIPFTGDTITGLDLLLKTGLDVKVEAYGGLGAWICKIGPDGCNYPGEACVCQSYGPGGVYWSYHHVKNGKWVSSSLGAGSYKVHDGEIDGWAWSSGKGPTDVPTFGQLCAVAAPTATPRLLAPTPTRGIPTANRRPVLTATPWATATHTPEAEQTEGQRRPLDTAVPATGTPRSMSTAVPSEAVTSTLTPVPTEAVAATVTPTQVIEPSATPTVTGSPPGGSSNSESTGRMVAIAAGLASALGFALWRVVVGMRTKGRE